MLANDGRRTSKIKVASLILLVVCSVVARGQILSTLYGTSYQVNVDSAGRDIPGDAANEPSFCIDPRNPQHIAVGWRQFADAADGFRQAGWAFSTNGGLNWTFPGVLDTNLFRSDPVLAADADGRFYYLGVLTNGANGETYYCDLWRSTNGGSSWEPLGFALGGDKEWMAVDSSDSVGRGNLYQSWSPFFNFTNNDPDQIFSRSTDHGTTWMAAIGMPRRPYFGTVNVGPDGTVYTFGGDGLGAGFVLNRSTNATELQTPMRFDQTTVVDLGGSLQFGTPGVNRDGLLGQPWVAVDRSTGSTRGNVYVLCSVQGSVDPADVMFARSTNGGRTFSQPTRINSDTPTGRTYHWFGTLSVAPNGRIDVCWNDTRSNTNNQISELYYSFSRDGGLNWSPNVAVSPPFNHTLGYPGQPAQEKMGDYIGMISLDDSACIAYTATFTGGEDIYFLRLEAPIVLSVSLAGTTVRLTWNTLAGRTYCVQVKSNPETPWSATTSLGCVLADSEFATMTDTITNAALSRFYRVSEQR